MRNTKNLCSKDEKEVCVAFLNGDNLCPNGYWQVKDALIHVWHCEGHIRCNHCVISDCSNRSGEYIPVLQGTLGATSAPKCYTHICIGCGACEACVDTCGPKE